MTRAATILLAALRFGVFAVPLTVAWTVAGVHIAVGIAAAAALGLWVVERRWPLRRTPADAAMAAFAATCIAATLAASAPAASAVQLKKLLLLPLVHLVVLCCDRPSRTRWALRLFAAGIAATALVAIVRFGIADLAPGARLRSTGHYMTFAGLLLLAAPICAGAAVRTRRTARLLYAAALVVIAAALLLSFTRGAWLGAIAAATALVWRRRRRAVVALPIAVAVAVALLPAAYRERARSAFDPDHPVNRDRVRLWRAAVEIWRDHPWTGVGLVDLAPYYLAYRREATGEVHGHVHDNWLQIAATLGTPGLLAFIWLMIAWGGIAARAAAGSVDPELGGQADGIWGAYWGFQVMGLFEWNFGDVEVTIALVYMIGAALAARAAAAAPGAGGAGAEVSP
jgi:O-antigen ligase